MRFAIVKSGVVINTAIADHPIDEDWVQSDVAGIGWSYVDGVFIDPDEEPAEQNKGGGGGPVEPP